MIHCVIAPKTIFQIWLARSLAQQFSFVLIHLNKVEQHFETFLAGWLVSQYFYCAASMHSLFFLFVDSWKAFYRYQFLSLNQARLDTLDFERMFLSAFSSHLYNLKAKSQHSFIDHLSVGKDVTLVSCDDWGDITDWHQVCSC